MAKNFVLHALRLLGLEEMLKLSQVLKVKQSSLKKAVGEDIVVWNEVEDKRPQKESPLPEGKLLKFKRTNESGTEIPEAPDASAGGDSNSSIVSSEFLLWQREMTKEAPAPKKEAVKGYSRSNEMYVVKNDEREGTGKIRFASTHGVLVNKKQG